MDSSPTKPADGSDKPEKAAGWRASKFPIPIRYAKAPAAAPAPPQAKRSVAGLTAEQAISEPVEGPGEIEEAEQREELFKHLDLTPAETAGASPTAVLVFHGMGQQVRFQTLSDLASAVLDEAEEQKGTVTSVEVKLAPKVGKPGQFLARVELAWDDAAGTPHEAHIYEAYWAPLTAGKVKYWDTVKFLVEGGKNGLSSIVFGGFKFQRWMFGDFQRLRINWTTPFALLGILLFLGMTVGMIAMALSAVTEIARHLTGANPLAAAQAVLDTVYMQIAPPWNWAMNHCGHGSWALASPGSLVPRWQYAIATIVWLALIWAAYFVRNFIIEYVGSVAAYLSPYKDSKFEKLRGDIQTVGLDAARLIYYGARDPAAAGWIPNYENIVIVGHSLGTVIAYDTLNAIFNVEQTSLPAGAPNTAVKRTKALITFGSPLDKSAFIFRAQFKRGTTDGKLREIAACAFQPLITSYKFRYDPNSDPQGPLWINLWSPMDIISGNLGYYDDLAVPEDDPKHVANEIDWGAWVPLYAHIQYWKTKKFRRKVYDQLI